MRRKRSFKRTRRAVSWLTSPAQRSTNTLTVNTVERFSLGVEDNDFVLNHPRFAKRNDVVGYRRILGDIRLSLYWTGDSALTPLQDDAAIDYGLCFVKGEYDETGTWTPTDQLPNPADTADEDDKWLYKNRVVLSFGSTLINSFRADSGAETLSMTNTNSLVVDGAGVAYTYLRMESRPLRPAMLSTDQQLPMGSKVDVTTRRKALYGEKLSLICYVKYDGADADDRAYYCEPNVRILIAG